MKIIERKGKRICTGMNDLQNIIAFDEIGETNDAGKEFDPNLHNAVIWRR